jgi:hypothetical protein
MKLDTKTALEGLGDLGLGTVTTIASLHAARLIPKYSGLVMLGVGAVAYMTGNKLFKLPATVLASIGAIKTINMFTSDNGIPSEVGIRGLVNKVVPQLNGFDGVPMLGIGNIQRQNENLLGSRADDLLGLNEASYDNEALEELTGYDDETMEGLGELM